MRRLRADLLLTRSGLCESRVQAKNAILAGRVRVGTDHVVRSASELLPEDAQVIVEQPFPYVSRGALKLLPALDAYLPSLDGMIALDLGASTGGFTDLMLQRGAVRVYAVDVGTNQLHFRLRKDSRVVSLEQLHARDLSSKLIPELVDVLTVDVSFISLVKVLPYTASFLRSGAWAFLLVKPQFEAGREEIGKGGVVRDEGVRSRVVEEVTTFVRTQLSWKQEGLLPSPIKGPAGNQEFVAVFRT